VTATQFTSQGGRGTSFGYKLPDWQIYNTSSGNALAFSNYTTDFLTIASTGAATFSSTINSGAITVNANFGLNLVSNNSNYSNITFLQTDGTTSMGAIGFNASSGNDMWISNNRSGNQVFHASSGQQWLTANTTTAAFKPSITTEGTVTIGLAGVGSSGANWLRLNYQLSASSRSWRVVNDVTANGDFSIQQSTTRTGSTYADALYFDASRNPTFAVLGTGTVYSNGGTLTNTNPSDSALKNTIKDYTYGLNEILQLKPKTYYYNSDSSKSMLKYGFIAQDVKNVMPDAVRKLEPNKPDSKLGLETDAIYVALVNAIKTLEARIKVLENK
jgi:hypothetical protein